ncbi:Phloem protein 2-like a1 [Thalictrum thalictroides]|uniref:Phloem protein 2-like a1 n=1 Tax=Thalictrum thalictroides TaxID=46969 RepID=A0A7J6WRM7_THATH|nr:Phloem protein 2-like a1 [Thalictrum thalictroides]
MGQCATKFQVDAKKGLDFGFQAKLHDSDPKQELNLADSNPKTDTKTGLVAESNIERLVSHKYEDILKAADTPIDRSSKEKLFAQLHSGVYLNQKKQKYWIDKESGLNCFMLFSKGLSINWVDDERYWAWRVFEDPEEGKLEMAELLKVCWLEVNGSLDPAILSPKTMYEIVYIFKLYEAAYGWESPVTLKTRFIDGEEIRKLSLQPSFREQWIEVHVGDGEPDIKMRKSSLLTKPRGQWIELVAGEFYTDPAIKKHICFSLCGYEGGKWKSGLLMKGVVLRPKKRE